MKNYVDHAEKLTDQLLKAMKALEYIFKFIVRSRVLFNQYVFSSYVWVSKVVAQSTILSTLHLIIYYYIGQLIATKAYCLGTTMHGEGMDG